MRPLVEHPVARRFQGQQGEGGDQEAGEGPAGRRPHRGQHAAQRSSRRHPEPPAAGASSSGRARLLGTADLAVGDFEAGPEDQVGEPGGGGDHRQSGSPGEARPRRTAAARVARTARPALSRERSEAAAVRERRRPRCGGRGAAGARPTGTRTRRGRPPARPPGPPAASGRTRVPRPTVEMERNGAMAGRGGAGEDQDEQEARRHHLLGLERRHPRRHRQGQQGPQGGSSDAQRSRGERERFIEVRTRQLAGMVPQTGRYRIPHRRQQPESVGLRPPR